MNSQKKKFYLSLYKKERELLFNAKLEQSKSFDKYIFTVSSIGLGLSLSWLDNISKSMEFILLLIIGWFCLASASIISLLSFLLSDKAIDKELENVNSYIDYLLHNKKYKEQPNKYSECVRKINWISFIALICGLLSIISFFSINLLKGG